jgi:hypothetical protein
VSHVASLFRIYLAKVLCFGLELPSPRHEFPSTCYNNSRRLHVRGFLPRQKGHKNVPSPRPQNLSPPLERRSRVSLSNFLNSTSCEYEVSESLSPAMLDCKRTRKEKDQMENFAKLSVEKAIYYNPSYTKQWPCFTLVASGSLGMYFLSLGLAAYLMRHFNRCWHNDELLRWRTTKTLEKQPPQWPSIRSVIQWLELRCWHIR